MESCTLKNVVYKSNCVFCNGVEIGTLADTRDDPSVYVGESSRSLQERALEHQKDYRKAMKTPTCSSTGWGPTETIPGRPSTNMKVVENA